MPETASVLEPVLSASGRSPAQMFDLYADLFSLPAEESSENVSAKRATRATPAIAPRAPVTLQDTGLHLGQLSEQVLKQLYLHGLLLGDEVALNLRLPFSIVDEALRLLKEQRAIEVTSGELVGRASYRFSLTDLGRTRAREAFEQCRYVGPAPVSMESYNAQCRRQTVMGMACNPQTLRSAFEGFVFRPGMLEEIGPAICTGRSLFIYGPPGNGKTMIAKGLGRFLNTYGGEIYVPYAIAAENSVISVFDPIVHQTTDDMELVHRGISPAGHANLTSTLVNHHEPVDLRWRRIRRPVVITGGELTLEMLELQFHETGRFYNAPLHIKSNGGVFLIDDFGRQLVSPRELLNRWIVPLEERVDYLTLETGRKLTMPFEQLIVFSTNLDPKDLVDDAFLRRIRHKMRIDPPDREAYTQIFQQVCRLRGVAYSEAAVDLLFLRHYTGRRLPRSSDPRDLLEIVAALCRFHDQPVELSESLVDTAARQFFAQL
jgi:hypothetical protein